MWRRGSSLGAMSREASLRQRRSLSSTALVLGAVVYLYAVGTAVAVESVRAMILRTVVWLVLFLGLAWVSRRNERAVQFFKHGA